jgi:hypothetical protein
MVIESHPRLEDGSPFPTLYWLTCPILIKRVSTLEAEGWMAVLNDRLARDRALRERLVDAIRSFEAQRDRHEVIPVSSPAGGGPDKVKCVHAHTAHELVASNPVGALALADTGWPDCVAPCREVW